MRISTGIWKNPLCNQLGLVYFGYCSLPVIAEFTARSFSCVTLMIFSTTSVRFGFPAYSATIGATLAIASHCKKMMYGSKVCVFWGQRKVFLGFLVFVWFDIGCKKNSFCYLAILHILMLVCIIAIQAIFSFLLQFFYILLSRRFTVKLLQCTL